jgi:beta-N-acetylhexosaminidase
MVSNAAVAGVTRLPASLSAAVIGGMLRGQLGFRGLVVTDSLSAGAVQSAVGSLPNAAVAALRAGADLLLFGSTLNANERALLAPAREQATFTAMVAAIVVAVRSGTLATARLTAAATAVVRAAGANLCG